MGNQVRWQYRVVNVGMFGTPDRLAAVLGQLGAGGWELVHVYDKMSNWLGGMEKGFAIFKREVAAGNEPVGAWATWNRATEIVPPNPKNMKADWKPDPTGRHPDRWWDGRKWTEWVRDRPGGTRSEDPPLMDLFAEDGAADGDSDEEQPAGP